MSAVMSCPGTRCSIPARPTFDVVTELWYESREAYEASMKSLADPAAAQALVEDERELFDLSPIRRFTIEERTSALPPGGSAQCHRSEDSRVGKECVITCRSQSSPY